MGTTLTPRIECPVVGMDAEAHASTILDPLSAISCEPPSPAPCAKDENTRPWSLTGQVILTKAALLAAERHASEGHRIIRVLSSLIQRRTTVLYRPGGFSCQSVPHTVYPWVYPAAYCDLALSTGPYFQKNHGAGAPIAIATNANTELPCIIHQHKPSSVPTT